MAPEVMSDASVNCEVDGHKRERVPWQMAAGVFLRPGRKKLVLDIIVKFDIILEVSLN